MAWIASGMLSNCEASIAPETAVEGMAAVFRILGGCCVACDEPKDRRVGGVQVCVRSIALQEGSDEENSLCSNCDCDFGRHGLGQITQPSDVIRDGVSLWDMFLFSLASSS